MTASLDSTDSATQTPSRHRLRRTLAASSRSLLYCLLLPALAIGAVAATLVGRAQAAAGWWRWLRTRVLRVPPVQVRRPRGVLAATGHALLSLLLGVVALVPLGIEALFIARCALYGLVDRGPYTDSWGGPTAAGAWLAHFLVGIPFAVAGLLALAGIAAMHQRLSRALDGERPAAWLIPVALVISPLGALFFVAWLRQLPS